MALAEIEANVWINTEKINILRHDPEWGGTRSAPVHIVLDGGTHICRMNTTMDQVCAAIFRAENSKKTWWERIMEEAEQQTEKEKGEQY